MLDKRLDLEYRYITINEFGSIYMGPCTQDLDCNKCHCSKESRCMPMQEWMAHKPRLRELL